jgi:hypothetical protein
MSAEAHALPEDDDLDALIGALGADRDRVIADIQAAVRDHISGRTTPQCLELVRRHRAGQIIARHPPRPTPRYAGLILDLYRGTPQPDGITLDSAMSDDLAEVVVARFQALYEQHNDAVCRLLLTRIVSDDRVLHRIVDALLDSSSAAFATKRTKDAVFAQLVWYLKAAAVSPVHQLGDSLASVAPAIGARVAALAGGAMALGAMKLLVLKIMQVMLAHLGRLAGKLLAVPAVKAAVTALVKKYVVLAVIAGIMKMIAAKASISAGAVVALIAAPIIAWFMYREWTRFPRRLADSVSTRLAGELGQGFDAINRAILGEMLRYVGGKGAAELAEAVAEDPEIKAALRRLGTAAEPALEPPE